MPRLFKLPQHKQFTYEPIYYDERKEKLQERIRNIEDEMGVKREGEEPQRKLTKGSFSYFHERKAKAQKTSSIRLLIIIAFLALVMYFLFYA